MLVIPLLTFVWTRHHGQVRAFSGNYGVPDWRGTDRRSRHRTWVEIVCSQQTSDFARIAGRREFAMTFLDPLPPQPLLTSWLSLPPLP